MTTNDVIAAVKSSSRLLPVGGGTKDRLSATGKEVTTLSLQGLAGIVEYQPNEYVITVKAGTTLAEVQAALAEKGQGLPFDPLWSASGATVGGTVAANCAGPGRLRFGGVRDFVIGVKLVDGRGRSLSGGGKVVKNAAGFDLAKLVVGSMGRLGILTEISLKVFPRPPAIHSRRIRCETHEAAMGRLMELSGSRHECDAIEYLPAQRELVIRLAGPAAAITALGQAIGGEPGPDESWWRDLNEFAWTRPGATLIRVPVTPRSFPALLARLEGGHDHRVHLSGGGATAWIDSTDPEGLASLLHASDVSGLVHRGPSTARWLGPRPDRAIDHALAAVFDPDHRFGDGE